LISLRCYAYLCHNLLRLFNQQQKRIMSLFLKQFIVYQAPYSLLIFLIFFYFLILYFGGGFLFDRIAAFLEQRKWLHRITQKVVTPIQIRFEIKHSVVSMFMFGISGSILIALIRAKIFLLATDTWMNLIIGVTILNIWNEVYFFIIHRLLHVPFLMRHIHWIHHRSVVPTVYSVYSFHWIEAFLLGSVPISIAYWVSFSPMTLLIYPITSILLNFAGHCNYRFGDGTGSKWFTFGTTHNEHHSKGAKKYGFGTFILDLIHQKIFNK
jgi:lathosterol oxidase